jgi:hypothetical protein
LNKYTIFAVYAPTVPGDAFVHTSAMVQSPAAGVFAALSDLRRFAEVFVEYGVVTWSGELDLALDAMHAELRAHGEWRLA